MLLGFLTTYWNVSIRRTVNKDGNNVAAENLIYTAAIWCAWLYAVTEFLSIGKWISTTSIIAAWGAYFVIQLFFLISYGKKEGVIGCVLREPLIVWKEKSNSERFFSLLFLCYTVLVLGLALQTPPYNCDSMIYHLSRIVNWSHNGSVAHFATENWREISSTPFAEFVGLHLYLFSGENDRFINLVQAVSNLLLTGMLYHLTRELGGSRKSGYLAAVLFATMPIAFVEANTTQNDEFAALWLVFVVYEMIRILRHPEFLEREQGGTLRCVVLFVSIGLGYLTKPTIFPAIGLFTIWLLEYLAVHNKVPVKTLFLWGITTAGGAFLTVLPEIGRNLSTYHAVSYYGVGARQIVGTARPAYLLINFLKNLSMNLPAIYWPNVYWRFEAAIYKLADVLHVSINDPTIAETGVAFHISKAPDYGCDTAVSFVVMILILLCSFLGIIGWIGRTKHSDKEKHSNWSLMTGYIRLAFVSYYVLLLIMRWEPYVNRYMLGYFAISIPAIVLELELSCRRYSEWDAWLQGCVFGAVFLLSAVEFVNMADDLRLKTQERKAQGEIATWFETGTDKIESYQSVVEYVQRKGYQKIGLKLDGAAFEYPLLRMLENSITDYRFVNVSNETKRYEDMDFQPDCILYTGLFENEMEESVYYCHGAEFTNVIRISDTCYVLEK